MLRLKCGGSMFDHMVPFPPTLNPPKETHRCTLILSAPNLSWWTERRRSNAEPSTVPVPE